MCNSSPVISVNSADELNRVSADTCRHMGLITLPGTGGYTAVELRLTWGGPDKYTHGDIAINPSIVLSFILYFHLISNTYYVHLNT
jgi:hypothetical protein